MREERKFSGFLISISEEYPAIRGPGLMVVQSHDENRTDSHNQQTVQMPGDEYLSVLTQTKIFYDEETFMYIQPCHATCLWILFKKQKTLCKLMASWLDYDLISLQV